MASKQKTKVAVIYAGARFYGGVETYYGNLFRDVDRDKFDLTLFSLGDWQLADEVRKDGGNVIVLSGSRINPFTIGKLIGALKRDSYNLVVSQGVVANAYARAASFFSGVPSLVAVHSDPTYDYPNPAIRAVYTVIDRLTRFQTRRYIAVSEYLKKQLVESGIGQDKVTVIYNGVDSPTHYPRKSENPGGPIVIGSIGRLHKVKNYAELINAAGAFGKSDIIFKIWGDGEEQRSLQRRIDRAKGYGIDNASLVDRSNDVWEAFTNIDIYIQPSLSEGFGLTVVEAMLAGKPVVVSPYGALPELVQDGVTGIVMSGSGHDDIIDAINNLLLHKDKMKQLAVAGQKFAREKFSVNQFVKNTEETYLEASK